MRVTMHVLRRRALPGATLALGFALSLAGFGPLGTTAARAASRIEGDPGPVVLLGVDGLSFDVLHSLVAAGRLPNFSRMLRHGVRAVLRSERPMRSPALWTTLATGQPRRVHRIYDFVTGSAYWPKRERGGQKRLVTSDMRAAPALWELASKAGQSVLVVGWLNTWPAEPVRGVMIAPYVALGSRRQTSIKGRIYADVERQAYPPDAFARLKSHVVQVEEVSDRQVARMVDEPPDDSPLFKRISRLKRYLYTVRWSIAATLTNTAIVEEELRRDPKTRLVMTYYDGADTLAHRFWLFRQPLDAVRRRLKAHGFDPAMAEELKARLGRAVDGYYELADSMLGRVWAAAGPKATMVVISDHGWGSLEGDRAPYDQVPFDGEHRLDGVFVAHGPHIRGGAGAETPVSVDPLTLYDVAPTVLYLAGVGVPIELPGRVALEIVKRAYAAQNPPHMLAARRPSPQAPAADSPPAGQAPFAAQEMERLRSLGYVQ